MDLCKKRKFARPCGIFAMIMTRKPLTNVVTICRKLVSKSPIINVIVAIIMANVEMKVTKRLCSNSKRVGTPFCLLVSRAILPVI